MSLSASPIGIFDSGLGGLTILAALQARLPHEDFIYFADTAFLPYGDRSEAFIQARSQAIAHALIQQGAKALVVACNTATAVAGEQVRACIRQPVIALEPAVKPAAHLTRSGIVAVLATTRTLSSQRFERLVQTHAKGVQVLAQPCPGLAEAIETLGPGSDTVARLLDQYVLPLAGRGADVVVLGCTHYPWVRAQIMARLAPGCQLVDTGEAVARQVARRLSELGCLRPALPGGERGSVSLASSAHLPEVAAAVARLWPHPVSFLPLEIALPAGVAAAQDFKAA